MTGLIITLACQNKMPPGCNDSGIKETTMRIFLANRFSEEDLNLKYQWKCSEGNCKYSVRDKFFGVDAFKTGSISIKNITTEGIDKKLSKCQCRASIEYFNDVKDVNTGQWLGGFAHEYDVEYQVQLTEESKDPIVRIRFNRDSYRNIFDRK